MQLFQSSTHNLLCRVLVIPPACLSIRFLQFVYFTFTSNKHNPASLKKNKQLHSYREPDLFLLRVTRNLQESASLYCYVLWTKINMHFICVRIFLLLVFSHFVNGKTSLYLINDNTTTLNVKTCLEDRNPLR